MGASHQRSKTELELEKKLQHLQPGTRRYEIVAAARGFKAAWVELAQQLTQVRDKGEFMAWGYSTFEAYCRREIHVRQDTAEKLTRSFAYLRDHEPKVLESRSLPPLDVVDLMSKARERAPMADDTWQAIRQEAFEPEGDVTRGKILKRLREAAPEAFAPIKAPEIVEGNPVDLKKAVMLAERLQSVLEGGLSPRCLTLARQIVADLRAQTSDSQIGA